MEANIFRVGNSKGVILPAKLMKLIGLKEKVSIDVKDNKIIISPAEKKVREGWEEIIKEEIEDNGQPTKLIPDVFSDEDLEEWQW
ncbi:AbrB/MazE/SpoVT family DNA-binding domain-containing protein [Zunongwangia sp. H14]|uniref:AbrB/MazE/SpoVT family DNA-binding domain-containing protein n=1 Tax=Zunongwangia sp. H14 TaxID=3240792 RepID=UPI0035692E51